MASGLLRYAALVLFFLLAFVLGTYALGERNEVAVLRSYDAQGGRHETRLWVVDQEGTPWLRVARDGRGWLERIRANPRVELVRGGRVQGYRATPVDDPEARAAVDARMAEKYGWADWWYGLLVRSHPIPVRLDRIDDEAGRR